MMHGWGFSAGGLGTGYGSRRFEEQYHCYSVAYADKSHLEVSKIGGFGATSPSTTCLIA